MTAHGDRSPRRAEPRAGTCLRRSSAVRLPPTSEAWPQSGRRKLHAVMEADQQPGNGCGERQFDDHDPVERRW